VQLRTRVAVLLAVASIAVASLVTCDRDSAPPDDSGVPEATDAVVPRERTPRRRVARPPVPVQPASEAGGGGGAGVSLSFPSGASLGAGGLSYDVADAPPTGRVRVRMLKDGRPFEGGHVCFMPEEVFVEPGPWDGTSCSDGAYTGLPMYTHMWNHFDPVLGSGAPVPHFQRARGVTGSDGRVTIDIAAGRTLVPFVRYAASGIPLAAQPRIHVPEGGEVTLTIETARIRTVTGRCLGSDRKPLPGIFVQAVAPLAERPLSRTVQTSATGTFELSVVGGDSTVRVRAVVPYVTQPLAIHESESDVPPIPAETTVTGVVPGGASVDVWMPPAPLVFIELTVAEGEPALSHLQIEGLAFDPRAAAWGRLGGPQYRRAVRGSGGRRAVIALPRAEAVRPLMLWSWGWTITAVDPRGADRVSVEIPRGRRAGVRGRGWKKGDRLRVVAFLGPAGREIPCIWIDDVVGAAVEWARDDSPVAAIEFQIVRDDVVVGRSARVPPGTGPATEVSIDLD